MKFYKILHIPTGLFFKPSRYPSKCNLGKIGKVYQRKPRLPKDGYYGNDKNERELLPFIESEWEIKIYETNTDD